MAAGVELSTERAVREVYCAHYAMLVGWTTKLVGEQDLAHDMVAEAFVRLLRHWGGVDQPRAWLYTTVANQVRDHWRKRGREAAAYQRLEAGGYDPQAQTTSSAMIDHASTISVRDAVQGLPDRLRVAVLLHYFADLPVAQVAQQMGKSEGTIKRDLFDARSKLAERLQGVR